MGVLRIDAFCKRVFIMKERYGLERELEALGVRSAMQLEKEIEHSGQIGLREFFGPLSPPTLTPSAFSTLGFEFDLNFGFEIEVANKLKLSPPPGFKFPSEGLQATNHEERDGKGSLKDGFVVTMDAVRMEISTVPLGLKNDKDFNIVKNNVKKFGEELISARNRRGKFNKTVNVTGVGGHPTTFEHPRTVVNKPNTHPTATCGGVQFPGDRKHATYKLAPVPLLIARVKKTYPGEGYKRIVVGTPGHTYITTREVCQPRR